MASEAMRGEINVIARPKAVAIQEPQKEPWSRKNSFLFVIYSNQFITNEQNISANLKKAGADIYAMP